MAKQKTAAPAAPPEFKEFEKGLQALFKKDLKSASDSFEKFISAHPEHPTAVERARVYRSIAKRRLESSSLSAGNPQEQRLHGVLLANRGDTKAAVSLLQKAIKAEPQTDLGHFLLASVAAEDGDTSIAIEHLRSAIQLNPLNRVFAHNLEEFETIRDQAAFQELLAEDDSKRGPKK